jgi:hypothetical protein
VVPPGRFRANATAEVSSESARQRLGFTGKPSLSKQTKFDYGATLPRVHGEQLNQQRLATLSWDNLRECLIKGTYGSFLTELSKNTTNGYIEEWNPALLATKAIAEDVPSWDEAMNGPMAAGFWKACETEIDTLVDKDCWDEVPRPKDRPVVSSTWAFRIKRFPDGTMRKLKA